MWWSVHLCQVQTPVHYSPDDAQILIKKKKKKEENCILLIAGFVPEQQTKQYMYDI